MEILIELYKFLFVASIIYILNIIVDLLIKAYGKFKLNKQTRFILSKSERIILWLSISIFISYLI
ncbi:MAG: hypothetical protein ACOC22_00130 [bacterium]